MLNQPDPLQKKSYFIGIDSDGTVFDSMEIKHKRVFQPIAVELWCLEPVEELYCSICQSINLYSELRGVNRFAGLAQAFSTLVESSELGVDLLQGHEMLQEFVQSDYPLSYAGLDGYNSVREDSFLDKVLLWSRRSDELYEEIMDSEGTPTFPGISGILERASQKSEIVVISSSSRITLKQDWGKAGLLPFVARIEGQEQGSKSMQLATASEKNLAMHHRLMIGDALSDLEAAQEHEMLFYPIIPGAEAHAWERFEAEALENFYKGTYAGDYEQDLLSEFHHALRSEANVCGYRAASA
jgi:phosphoglycolate phosphatase-like HAD superfamily hydrolase